VIGAGPVGPLSWQLRKTGRIRKAIAKNIVFGIQLRIEKPFCEVNRTIALPYKTVYSYLF
jgi:hypothetical protein